MTMEEEQIGVAHEINLVELISLQASNGEAPISSLLKTTTMTTEDEEIGPTSTSPFPCFLKSPSIVPESSLLLGSGKFPFNAR
ncbi:hypothetical protein Vadar_018835 [Vaccinium darrowii]|uniref:Uncharacterized protein n=1 Tax=Vaccinium darrowii TaxID=229202 RepID=A0ACB7YWP2_9ERIC|nr:hypothetical protein Vadar_018835 [Vaccinium darrowii]